MSDETYSFEQARVRLEEIASQVRRKDTSLEKSLDLLEEGVRLANLATEQIDRTQWVVPAPATGPDAAIATEAAEGDAADEHADAARDALDAGGEAPDEDAAAEDDAPDEDTGA